jgi:threonine/homoserine/homoserine lactone efflux protein
MSILFNGFVLGWSVAWPPGPVNAEMIRRGLLPRKEGGGFWETWSVGLGACTGDFLWAFAVAAGAGALLNNPTVRIILGIISLVLLLVLAVIFSRAAWETARRTKSPAAPGLVNQARARGGYWLGLLFVMSSPWNIGFWLAVVGSQQTVMPTPSFLNSLILACAVSSVR